MDVLYDVAVKIYESNLHPMTKTGLILILVVGILLYFILKKRRISRKTEIGTSIENVVDNGRSRVLFIDDQHHEFRIVDTLRRDGWLVFGLDDLESLNQVELTSSKFVFIDRHGVGGKLQFKDGLELAIAVKTKYPQKIVCLYSTDKKGDIFDGRLKILDHMLYKNSNYLEFEAILNQSEESHVA